MRALLAHWYCVLTVQIYTCWLNFKKLNSNFFHLNPLAKRPVAARPDERACNVGTVRAPAAKADCFVAAMLVPQYDVFDCCDAVRLYDVPAMPCGTPDVY